MIIKKVWAMIFALCVGSVLPAAALPSDADMLAVLKAKAVKLIQANINDITAAMPSIDLPVLVPAGARDSAQDARDALVQEVAYQNTVAAIFDDINDSYSRGAFAAEKISDIRASMPQFEQFMKKNAKHEFGNDRSKTRYKVFAYLIAAALISNKILLINSLVSVYSDPFFQPQHRTVVAEEFRRLLEAGLPMDDGDHHVNLIKYFFGKRALTCDGLAVMFDQLAYAARSHNETIKNVMAEHTPWFWGLRRLPHKAYRTACKMLASGIPQIVAGVLTAGSLAIMIGQLMQQPLANPQFIYHV